MLRLVGLELGADRARGAGRQRACPACASYYRRRRRHGERRERNSRLAPVVGTVTAAMSLKRRAAIGGAGGCECSGTRRAAPSQALSLGVVAPRDVDELAARPRLDDHPRQRDRGRACRAPTPEVASVSIAGTRASVICSPPLPRTGRPLDRGAGAPRGGGPDAGRGERRRDTAPRTDRGRGGRRRAGGPGGAPGAGGDRRGRGGSPGGAGAVGVRPGRGNPRRILGSVSGPATRHSGEEAIPASPCPIRGGTGQAARATVRSGRPPCACVQRGPPSSPLRPSGTTATAAAAFESDLVRPSSAVVSTAVLEGRSAASSAARSATTNGRRPHLLTTSGPAPAAGALGAGAAREVRPRDARPAPRSQSLRAARSASTRRTCAR